MIPLGVKWGWRHDVEDRDTLLNSAAATSSVLAMRGHYDDQPHEKLADFLRANLRVHNQGSQGSCRGHSGTAGLETCLIIAGGDHQLQLSSQYFYIQTQRLDGIQGDRGSTIQNGIKLMRERGCCPEEFWPYPQPVNYQTAPPGRTLQECHDAATPFRIRKHYDLREYEAARAFLASNQGPIDTGIIWTESMASAHSPTIESYGGREIGGHAALGACLSRRLDSSRRPYIWILNSWGDNWAQRGWKECSPAAWNQFSRDRRNVLIGISDMENPTPRPWDFVRRPVTH